MVQNLPCYRASSLLFPHWDIKTKANQASLVQVYLFLKMPSARDLQALQIYNFRQQQFSMSLRTQYVDFSSMRTRVVSKLLYKMLKKVNFIVLTSWSKRQYTSSRIPYKIENNWVNQQTEYAVHKLPNLCWLALNMNYLWIMLMPNDICLLYTSPSPRDA